MKKARMSELMKALAEFFDNESVIDDPKRRARLVAQIVSDTPQIDGPEVWLIDVEPPVVIVREEPKELESLKDLQFWEAVWQDGMWVVFDVSDHDEYQRVGNWYYDDWTPPDDCDDEDEEELELLRKEDTWQGSVGRLGTHYFANDAHFGWVYHLNLSGDIYYPRPFTDYSIDFD